MEEKGFAFDEQDVVTFDFGSSFTVFDSENELNKEEASKESKKEETGFSFNFGDTNMTNGEEDASLKEGEGSSFSLFSNEQSEKVFEAVDGVKSSFEKTNEAENQETDDEEPEIVEGEEEHAWGEPEHAWVKVLQETRKFQQGLANVIAEAHEKTVGGGFDFLNDNNEEEEEQIEDTSFTFNFDVVSYAAETEGEQKPSTLSSKKKEKEEGKNPYLGLIEKSNSYATIVRFEDKVEDFSNKMSNFNFLEKEEGEPDELPSAGPEMLEMFTETKNVEDDMHEYCVRLMGEAGTISNYSNRVREKVDALDLLCLRRLCSDNVVRYEVDGRWYHVRNNEFVNDYYVPEEGADRSIYREKFTLHELSGLAQFCLRYRSIMGKCLWKQIEPSYLEYPDDNIDCSEYLSLFWVSNVHCLEVAPVLNKALDTSLTLQAFPFNMASLSFPNLLHQHVVFPATYMFGHFGNDDETTEVDRFWTLEMLLCQEQIVGAVRRIPCFTGIDLEDELFKKDQMQIVDQLSNQMDLDFSPSFTRVFRTALWLRYKGWSKFRFKSDKVLEYLGMMQTEGSTIKALKILREKEGDLKLIPKSVFDYVLIPFIRSPPFEPAGVIPGLTPIEMSIFASNTRKSKLV